MATSGPCPSRAITCDLKLEVKKHAAMSRTPSAVHLCNVSTQEIGASKIENRMDEARVLATPSGPSKVSDPRHLIKASMTDKRGTLNLPLHSRDIVIDASCRARQGSPRPGLALWCGQARIMTSALSPKRCQSQVPRPCHRLYITASSRAPKRWTNASPTSRGS